VLLLLQRVLVGERRTPLLVTDQLHAARPGAGESYQVLSMAAAALLLLHQPVLETRRAHTTCAKRQRAGHRRADGCADAVSAQGGGDML
jgi:hypothetical protein